MKRILIIAAIGSALFIGSCKEKDAPTPATPATTTPIPADGWIIDGKKYTQYTVQRINNEYTLKAYDDSKPANTFSVSFHRNLPATNRKYKIVAIPDITSPLKYPAEKANDGEMVIFGSTPNASNNTVVHLIATNEAKEATVTINNGKIKVEIPELTMTDGKGNTIKATGTIEEK